MSEICGFSGCCLPGKHKYACRDKRGMPLSLVADKNEAAEHAISNAMFAARKAAMVEKAGDELNAPPPALHIAWKVFAEAACTQARLALLGETTQDTWVKAQDWMSVMLYCITHAKEGEK